MSKPPAAASAAISLAAGLGMAASVAPGGLLWLGFAAGFIPALLILAALYALAGQEGAPPP